MNIEHKIAYDLNLKKKGSLYYCFSGTHQDRTPSMSFWNKGNKFHCFACGFNYDIYDHNSKGFKTEGVYNFNNNVLSYSKPQNIKNFNPIGNYIKNYFKGRKIDLDDFKDLNLKQGKYFKTIVFPIYNEFNTHITNKFRNVETKDIYFDKNTNCKTLYNINNVEKNRPLFITEGESDLFSCLTAFKNTDFKNFVSLVTGVNSKLTPDILNYLKNFPEVVLCLDNDNAGQDGQEKIKNIFKEKKINYSCFKWNDLKFKDMNEILTNLGAKVLKQMLIKSCNFRA